MSEKAGNIRWDVLDPHRDLFHQYGLENPERLIRESTVVKEGHQRAVYRHKDEVFYVKRMRPGKAGREWRNWKRLYEEGVPTTTPVALGISPEYGYLISLAQHDWIGLYEIFDPAANRQKVRLLQKLGDIIRTMHANGFHHGDLHGGNFLARWNQGGPEIIMVDFQRGRFCKLSEKQRLDNIAGLAVSRYFSLGVRDRLAFLTGYLGSSKAAGDFIRHDGQLLEERILRRADSVAHRKVRRYRKVNKYFDRLTVSGPPYKGVYLRSNRGIIPASFVSSPLAFLYRKDVQLLKDSRSVRVIRHANVCIKYYKRRGQKDVLKGWLGLTKGKKSFRWALALMYRRIPTPEPVCYLDGTKGDSFYISHFLDSSQKLSFFLRDAPPEERKTCLKALAPFLKVMFYRGIYHLDLKGSNVLVGMTRQEPRFSLIDTDGVAIFWRGSHTLLRKSLLRITRALCSHFDRQELTAFVESCLSGLPVRLSLVSSPRALVDRALAIEAAREPRRTPAP